jgi:mono/diheme cytochrome c family protein
MAVTPHTGRTTVRRPRSRHVELLVELIAATLFVGAAYGSATPVGAAGGAPGDDLPEGAGKKVLLRACTTCHDLGEVVKFKGYYTRPQWRDIVVTMKEYGAVVDDAEIEVLSDYLAEVLGKKE